MGGGAMWCADSRRALRLAHQALRHHLRTGQRATVSTSRHRIVAWHLGDMELPRTEISPIWSLSAFSCERWRVGSERKSGMRTVQNKSGTRAPRWPRRSDDPRRRGRSGAATPLRARVWGRGGWASEREHSSVLVQAWQKRTVHALVGQILRSIARCVGGKAWSGTDTNVANGVAGSSIQGLHERNFFENS
jgi:hypothetical protein